MNTHLVTVVIPTYNRAALVVDAIESVLCQRECHFELIVVDDGSTDATRSVLASWKSQLQYVRQEHQGVAAARNAGARVARGEWLSFLDSDDWWHPGKLAAQLAFHDTAPGIPVSQTEEIWMRDGRRVNPCAHHRKPQGDIFVPSLARCLISPSAVMLRRGVFEAAGGFDESMAVCEDYDLWLRIACRVPVGLVAQSLVVKRGGHADQLSRQFWGMDRFRVAALLKLLESQPLTPPRRQALIEVLQQKCAVLAQGARRRQRPDEAERYLRLARVYADV